MRNWIKETFDVLPRHPRECSRELRSRDMSDDSYCVSFHIMIAPAAKGRPEFFSVEYRASNHVLDNVYFNSDAYEKMVISDLCRKMKQSLERLE